jgi:Fe-S cluster biogenesis protein NfuA
MNDNEKLSNTFSNGYTNEDLKNALESGSQTEEQDLEVVAYEDLSDNEKAAFDQLWERVEKVIDEIINPQLEKHNGWVELADIEGSTAVVRFRGACSGCEGMTETVDSIVVPALRKNVRAIRNVEITDEIDPEIWEMAKQLFTHRSDNEE